MLKHTLFPFGRNDEGWAFAIKKIKTNLTIRVQNSFFLIMRVTGGDLRATAQDDGGMGSEASCKDLPQRLLF